MFKEEKNQEMCLFVPEEILNKASGSIFFLFRSVYIKISIVICEDQSRRSCFNFLKVLRGPNLVGEECTSIF